VSLNVDLTLHGFDESLLKEFVTKIVKPYFNGNVNEAVKALMHRAIVEENFVGKRVEPVEVKV
jgi:hypothetical protein